MFKNYLKIAVRSLQRHLAYSLINITGLSIGIACCLLLTLYLLEEFSYDKHHVAGNQIYRVITQIKDESKKLGTVSPPIAPALHAEIPEVVASVRLLQPPGITQNLIKYEDQLFYESDGYIGDSTLFEVFTYEFIEGTAAHALIQPNTVVISETLALKLFNTEPALNKVIAIAQGYALTDYKITGVIRQPGRSFINPNFIISMTSDSDWTNYLRSDNAVGEWAGQNFIPSYVRLHTNHDVAEVEKKMNVLLEKHGSEDMKALGLYKTLGLEPVQDIYLKSAIDSAPRIKYLYVIGTIAAFILLIGCINFMNLSTAKSAQRASEVGLRKVMGAFRSSLIKQFLGEALLLVSIAMVLGIVMVQVALPYFNNLTSATISMGSNNKFILVAIVIGTTIITALLAGGYPAFYLSSFQPTEAIKSKTALSNASTWLRKSLVVFQFMIAIVLVCGMIIMSQQLHYMQNQNLGFNASAKVSIPLRTASALSQYEQLLKEFEKETNVSAVSGASYIPGTPILSDMSFYPAGSNMEKGVMIRRNTVDYDYLKMMDFKLVAGRLFNSNRKSESQGKMILNKTSAKQLGFEPEAIIGQPLYFEWQGTKHSFEVIGVVEDFHQISLKEEITPIAFEMMNDGDNMANMILTLNTSNINQTLATLESTFKKLVNDTPFEYVFLDSTIAKQYDEDKRTSRIIIGFTSIALFISSLGLYGLSAFMAERRYKEIGVRKVLGASVTHIVGMMSQEFIRLVLIAFILSVPVAWYAMTNWLAGFAYHIPINLMVFLFAGFGALTIALLTVSFESFKAASVNPVKSLRNE